MSVQDSQSGFVECEGARLWVVDSRGDGPAVVLCHPASQGCAIWRHQQRALAGAGYRVIAYARRGYDGSDAGHESARGTSTGDLKGLLDALHIERAHIVGAAAGGITATGFAVVWPDRVHTLCLVGTIIAPDEAEWRRVYARLGIDAVRDHVPLEFLELGPSYRATQPDGVAEFVRSSAAARPRVPVLQPLGSDVNWQTLRSLRCPTLLITGDADLYAPPPLQELVAKHIPDHLLETLPAVGHAPYWEQPESFNRLLLDFLSTRAMADISTNG